MRKCFWWWTAAVAAILVAAAAALAIYWPTIRILTRSGAVGGKCGEIPKTAAALPPIERGRADWTRWRGERGDGRSAVTGIRTDWTGGLTKLWEVNYLCRGDDNACWSAPVVAGNRLVAPGRDGSRDVVFCLEAATGELLWTGSYEAQCGSSHGRGPRATPAVDGDRAYTFGRGGDLACWSLFDGSMKWRRNVNAEGGAEPQWGHASSPLVVGDLVVVQGGGECRAVAFDKMTGGVAWKSGRGTAGYAAPAQANVAGSPALLIFHGKGLACLQPGDGRELWDVPWETPHGVNATTPVVQGDLVFITSGYGRGGALLRMGSRGAQFVWTTDKFSSHHSDPAIVDGSIYGYDGQSYQNRGKFKCLDLATGAETWSTSSIGWGTATWVDNHFICMDIRGNLYLVRPQPSSFALVAEFRGALGDVDGPAWTVPVVANGRLYLRCKQMLACYDIMRR